MPVPSGCSLPCQLLSEKLCFVKDREQTEETLYTFYLPTGSVTSLWPLGDILSHTVLPAAVAIGPPGRVSCLLLLCPGRSGSAAPKLWPSHSRVRLRNSHSTGQPSRNGGFQHARAGNSIRSQALEGIRLSLWLLKPTSRPFLFPWRWDTLPPGSGDIVSFSPLVSFPI